MRTADLVTTLREGMSVSRVFGQPYERDGVTVIPAATIRGGAGGGNGKKAETSEEGEGGGLGLVARPAGAYVIKDGAVSWQPGRRREPDRHHRRPRAGWPSPGWSPGACAAG